VFYVESSIELLYTINHYYYYNGAEWWLVFSTHRRSQGVQWVHVLGLNLER